MAYEKQVWNCGDTITADKMNHIEEGIENAQSAISVAKNKLVLDALSFEPPLRTTSFCVVEGTCCEEAPT